MNLRIKEFRKAAGLKQYELAERCGLTRSAISNYEKWKRLPNLESFVKICKALGASADMILGTKSVFTSREEK